MKTLTMTEFRKEPGERIIDVIRNRESFLLTKAGKPVAVLCPVEDWSGTAVVERDGKVNGPLPVTAGSRVSKYVPQPAKAAKRKRR